MLPRTREEFVEAVLELAARRALYPPFPGDWVALLRTVEGWADRADSHAECMPRSAHRGEVAALEREIKDLEEELEAKDAEA